MFCNSNGKHQYGWPARVGGAFRVPKYHDLRADALARDVQDANCPEPRRQMMREDWAPRVHQHHVVAELQALDVRVAADDHVDLLPVEGAIDQLADP